MSLALLPIALAFVSWQGPASAGGPGATERVVVATVQDIVLDGRVDEAGWRRSPGSALAMSPGSRFHAGTDGRSLYLAILMPAPGPADRLEFVLAPPPGDLRVRLTTEPSGRRSATVDRGANGRPSAERLWQNRSVAAVEPRFDRLWSGHWDLAVARDDTTWSVELRVPFASLDLTALSGDWDVTIRRRTGTPARWVRQTVVIGGIRPEPDGPIAVTPQGVGTIRQQRSGIIATTRFQDFGVQARLSPARALTADLAINPDFTAAEPDEQRVNLTRFRLYAPERRQWFGPIDRTFRLGLEEEVELFATRRIGFDSLGREAPIVAAGRVAASFAGIDVGILQVLSDENRNQRGQSITAARVATRLGRLRLGGLAVRRAARTLASDRNLAFGGDGRLTLGHGWSVGGWAARTDSPRLRGGDGAFGAAVTRSGSRWHHEIAFAQIGEFFNPEVGFLTRRGVRIYEIESSGLVPIDAGGMTAIRPRLQVRKHDNLAGFNESTSLAAETGLEFGAGLRVTPSVTSRREGLEVPFLVAPGLTLPPGRYSWVETGLGVATDPSRKIAVAVRFDGGGLYHGTQLGGGLTATVRPVPRAGLSLLVDHSTVSLPTGRFERTLTGLRADLAPGAGLSWRSLIQYDNGSRVWSGHVFLGWLDRHGTGLALRFDDAHEADAPWRWVRPQTRIVSLSASKQVRPWSR
ncbi:MAG: hypothetical protein JNJ80_12135 [Gemmatimonadetes bacterium]|nr:hypothetical protein [Gemmatimonadota bacterium]